MNIFDMFFLENRKQFPFHLFERIVKNREKNTSPFE